MLRSISDDDLCATCRWCWYRPGRDSACQLAAADDWPADLDDDGYAVECIVYTDAPVSRPTAEDMRAELADLEEEFERAGGRGVELADRIDRLRFMLEED